MRLVRRATYNGSLARITDDPRKAWLLYSDGSPRELIDLPGNFAAFQYGWATTSHKSQGRTAENVVAAAQALDRKTFYVALSRGRQNMVLHCPEKDFLKQQLQFRHGDRLSVHDLAADGIIPSECLLPLSEDARARKEKLLPDVCYKSIGERLKRFADSLKTLVKRVMAFRKRRIERRSRFAKYPYGPITEKTLFELEPDRPHAILMEKSENPDHAIPPEHVLTIRSPEHDNKRDTCNPGMEALVWLAEQTRKEQEIQTGEETPPAVTEHNPTLPELAQPKPRKSRPDIKDPPEPDRQKKKSRGMDI